MTEYETSTDSTDTPTPDGTHTTDTAPEHQSPIDQAVDAVKKLVSMVTGRNKT